MNNFKIESTDFQHKFQDNSKRKESSFQQLVLGQPDIYMQKNEHGTTASHHMQNLTQNGSPT